MTDVASDIQEAMDRAQTRVPATLRLLCSYRGLTQRQIGTRTGIHHQNIHLRMKGRQRINERDVAMFAKVFDVPEHVIFMEPDEALRWVLDNRPNPPAAPIVRLVAGGDSVEAWTPDTGSASSSASPETTVLPFRPRIVAVAELVAA